ncbi:hypothetical protein [Sinomonas atrocyanea]|uniref:hypothetical protein n=1 Tax=Sinomonas atrocyanea TaxID=37927 RepID=UPI0008361F99|nr:hypothetical protein [Sinomonas atrocyanea]
MGVKFRRQLHRVVEFSASCGRLPSIGRPASAEERRLGMWLHRQRRRHRDRIAAAAEAALLARALGSDWARTPGLGAGRRGSAGEAAGDTARGWPALDGRGAGPGGQSGGWQDAN